MMLKLASSDFPLHNLVIFLKVGQFVLHDVFILDTCDKQNDINFGSD